MKQKYYELTKLLDCKCNWMILFGMRSNGKSYAVKKHILTRAYKDNEQFVYLRRWREDIKEATAAAYFDDMPIREITENQYIGVMAYRGYFYFYDVQADKQIRGPKIGRYCALNEYERYKSQVFADVHSIVYEEFLTDRIYLGNSINSEPKMLMQFVSTVARDRNINIFLIGNTISRVCPYFSEWALSHVMEQKPGTIDIYHLTGENGTVDIAVENCEVIETKSKMFFGHAAKQITRGEWEVNEVPKLLKPYDFYDVLYELKAVYNNFAFVLQLMMDPDTGGLFVYIYPYTSNRPILRIITDKFSPDPFTSNGLNGKIIAECHIAEMFRTGKVCYSDNLTGTDFKQILKNYDFKGVKI